MSRKQFIPSGFYYEPYLLTSTNMYRYALYGNCVSLSGLALETMRAIGIPTTAVLVNKFGRTARDHIASAVLDASGTWQYFNVLGQAPGDLIFEDHATKIYRESPINSAKLTKKQVAIFETLGTLGWEDVTKSVTKTYDLELHPITDLKDNEIVYLTIFNPQTIASWTPIDYGIVADERLKFKHIGGKNVVYLAITKQGHTVRPVSDPFILKNDGTLEFLKPQKARITIKTHRKYPPKPHLNRLAKQLNGAMVQASNNPRFKPYTRLYTLKDVATTANKIIAINSKQRAYRYYRLVYPKIERTRHYDIAQIGFGNNINGQFVAAKESFLSSEGLSPEVINTFFDTDLLTYSAIYQGVDGPRAHTGGKTFVGLSEPVWVGIDLGSPKPITQFNYSPRTDKNGIYPHMQYELLYWDKRWQSAGVVRGDNTGFIQFENVPQGTLYWLRNHTEGQEERPFTYENQKQVWW